MWQDPVWATQFLLKKKAFVTPQGMVYWKNFWSAQFET